MWAVTAQWGAITPPTIESSSWCHALRQSSRRLMTSRPLLTVLCQCNIENAVSSLVYKASWASFYLHTDSSPSWILCYYPWVRALTTQTSGSKHCAENSEVELILCGFTLITCNLHFTLITYFPHGYVLLPLFGVCVFSTSWCCVVEFQSNLSLFLSLYLFIYLYIYA